MTRGVPTGYTHNWAYRGHWRERKIAPGRWKISFKATKRTKSGGGGPGTGSKLHWRFTKMRQTARKSGKGRYETHLTGEKHLVKANIKPRSLRSLGSSASRMKRRRR